MKNREQESNRSSKKKISRGVSQFAKYSALGIQMAAIIGIAVWGGMKLDEKTGNEKSVFTVVFSLLGVFAAVYTALKDFIKMK